MALGSQPLNYPTQPLNYGNFVPNYSLGGVEPPPVFWDEGEAEEEEELEIAPPARVHRQQDHVVSDEEDNVVVVPQVQGANLAPGQAPAQEGLTAALVGDQLAELSEADRVGPRVDQGVGSLLERYIKEGNSWQEMERLSKLFPRTENVENMLMPRLDEEVYQIVDCKAKGLDSGFQSIQRAVLATMAALAPLLFLTFKRSKKDSGVQDKELDALGNNQLNAPQLLAHTHNSISIKRRELPRNQLSPVYWRLMAKSSQVSQGLYGGNLEETTKQCDVARKISDKVKRKSQQEKKPHPQKRFRHAFVPQQMGQPMLLRAFNPYQSRFPGPQQFQQGFQQSFHQAPYAQQQFFPGGFGYPRRPRFQKNQRPFGKRGTHK